jgi:long-chain acyl-CoA synthetase
VGISISFVIPGSPLSDAHASVLRVPPLVSLTGNDMAIETIPQQFLHCVETYDNDAAFRYKEGGRYVDVSHREALERVHNAALGLQALGLAKQDRVALLSENRIEWAVADLAILSAGCINVPVYPTLPVKQVEYILGDSEARAVFVADDEQLAKVLESRPRLPTLQHVISFDASCETDGVLTMEALVARGAMVPDKPSYRELISTIGKYDWASVIYTSGTTGEPKGSILTHWNFLNNVNGCLSVLKLGPSDTCLSWLPLSHVFERTAGYYVMLTAGATIAYAESIETLVENLQEVSPTVVCSVPRFYEKMYARVLDAVEQGSGMKRSLFNWAIKTGHKYVSEKLGSGVGFLTKGKRGLADKLVFHKLKARTGGRIRFFVSGGAPLAPDINRFFHAAGIPILEGYGLTETAPVLACNTFEDLRFGTVGKPLPNVEIKIAEDGEILARGENVMLGYYKKPDDTNEAIVDGWFHTGDIGYLDDDGFLVITDRKKDVIVTAGGKNVAPQAIENRLKFSKFIDEAIIIGNHRRFVTAVIVPNFENLEEYAQGKHVPHATHEEMVDHPQVRKLFAEEIDGLCEQFATFERVKKFLLLDRALSIETGELTPSLKVKRRIIESKYKDQIDSLYTE